MDLDTYQSEAIRTASNAGDKVVIFALGLCGEAGEVADLIKKHKGHGHDLDKTKLTKELGDVLWYIATLADQLGISLDVIAQTNVNKLRARYPTGFNTADSHAKRDEQQLSLSPNLDGLARREAFGIQFDEWTRTRRTVPKPPEGSPGVDANGSPIE